MRMRFISVTYDFGGSSTSLERHYRELREAMLQPGQSYAYMKRASAWRPPTDIHEMPDAYLVKMELAGMRDEDIDIALYPNALVITGQREDDKDHDETVCYHEAQVRYGSFRTDLLLPSAVRPDEAEATYDRGFLRIRLPKAVGDEVDDEADDDRGDTYPAAGRKTVPGAPANRRISYSAPDNQTSEFQEAGGQSLRTPNLPRGDR